MKFHRDYPPLVNWDAQTEFAMKVAQDAFGAENVDGNTPQHGGGEDFWGVRGEAEALFLRPRVTAAFDSPVANLNETAPRPPRAAGSFGSLTGDGDRKRACNLALPCLGPTFLSSMPAASTRRCTLTSSFSRWMSASGCVP